MFDVHATRAPLQSVFRFWIAAGIYAFLALMGLVADRPHRACAGNARKPVTG